jgi:16S rRNA G966 N2-methylase RsmD
VELADIDAVHTVLEPSAGQGGLADVIGKGKALCVEISTLNCKVLESKGHSVINADFLEWATGGQTQFDRIILSPPFSQGRWQAHITAAAGLVAPGGALVAILPASAKNKDLMPVDMSVEWHGPFDNEFAGTSVSVVILKATRNAA